MSGRLTADDDQGVAECSDVPSTSEATVSAVVVPSSSTLRSTGRGVRAIDLMVDDSDETALLARHYHICDVIKKGPICTLYRATSRASRFGQQYHKAFMIKSLDVRRYLSAFNLNREDVEQEVEICASLKHPYFCELKDVIHGSRAQHMVFEYVEGSDICFEIVKRVSSGFIYSEAVASHYTRQLMEALRYLHSQNIVHRDIRPHNILLANKENNAPLKICGFGIAQRLTPSADKCLGGRIGVPYFMAPEIVAESEYGMPVDIWSAGVVLYLLLFGQLPFIGTIERVYQNICSGNYLKSSSDLWTRTISEPAKDLLKKLLCVDAVKRLTADEALKHSWLADRSLASRVHLNETVDNIRKYNMRRKLKSNIISTVNNPRWNRFPVDSFLSAESVPGGDSCDFECTRRCIEPPVARLFAGDDIAGVQMVLSSLDKAAILTDFSISGTYASNVGDKTDAENDHQLTLALNDHSLHELLLLYDRIRTHGIRPSPLNRNAELCLTEARDEVEILTELGHNKAELSEIGALLANAHIQALFQAHDIVIEEVFVSALPTPSAELLSALSIGENRSRADEKTKRDASTVAQTSGPTKPVQLANGSLKNLLSAASETTRGHIDDAQLLSESTDFGGASTSGILKNRPMPSSHNFHVTAKSIEDVPTLFYDNDNDDLLLNAVSRVRLVQFQKDTEEPMGITLKITENNRCFIARIMHGGLIHRHSTLHVGDEIREINGASVANQSIEDLQRILRDIRGQVQFKIVPSYRSAPPACEIYIRAQYDYDPAQDDLIPCAQAGVAFRTGDVLQVISKEDHNWWQARFIAAFPAIGNIGTVHRGSAAATGTASSSAPNTVDGAAAESPPTVAGLIPSPELQEWRTACVAMEQAKDTSTCMWFNKKKKYYTTKYLKKNSELLDQLDLVTYEEVIRLSSFRRKTLVLLGAHGVGRRHIKNTIIHRHPQRFAYPQPHTTRPMLKEEVDGKHYFFVSNDVMLADIQANEYLEYGTHKECIYGTKLDTIRSIHRSGKMAILDVEPQALKVLRTAEYAPFVVFIAAPDLHGLQDPDGSLERLLRDSDMLKQAFGHLFDYVIYNNDVDKTIRHLEVIVEKLNVIPQWVPVSWVYS